VPSAASASAARAAALKRGGPAPAARAAGVPGPSGTRPGWRTPATAVRGMAVSRRWPPSARAPEPGPHAAPRLVPVAHGTRLRPGRRRHRAVSPPAEPSRRAAPRWAGGAGVAGSEPEGSQVARDGQRAAGCGSAQSHDATPAACWLPGRVPQEERQHQAPDENFPPRPRAGPWLAAGEFRRRTEKAAPSAGPAGANSSGARPPAAGHCHGSAVFHRSGVPGRE